MPGNKLKYVYADLDDVAHECLCIHDGYIDYSTVKRRFGYDINGKFRTMTYTITHNKGLIDIAVFQYDTNIMCYTVRSDKVKEILNIVYVHSTSNTDTSIINSILNYYNEPKKYSRVYGLIDKP